MDLETLKQYQDESTLAYLQSLTIACRDRYLKAARLLEQNSAGVESVARCGNDGPVSISLLLRAYAILCKRYNEEYFSPQENLFYVLGRGQDAKWSRYFWWELKTALIARDSVVLNVLRAVGALPCADPVAASKSLNQESSDMLMPALERTIYPTRT
jgi:hypothetical protein